MKEHRLMRSSLYTGGTNPAMMVQAGFYDADCLVYDLEDSVPESQKDAARFLVYHLLKSQRPKGKYTIIRVNGLYSRYIEEDLQMSVAACPDAIRLPKVEYPQEVEKVDQRITELEKIRGIPEGSIELWCNIESYMGVLNARSIAKASPRIAALALGAEDFTASMMARRTKPGWEIFHARNEVLMACREAGISAQDAVFSDIRDMEGLEQDLEMTRTLGFDGKTCVHPLQIEAVNRCFTPLPKEIRYAERVLEALQEAERAHTGVCTLDGGMVDKPMEKRARDILAKARAAGVYEGTVQQ